MEVYFDHERLRVYQDSIAFIAWSEETIRRCPGRLAAKQHLDDASTSVALNIAEGNAKFSNADRCRFLEIACGSALECAACLDVLVAKKRLTVEEVAPGKMRLYGIVSMLIALAKSVSSRVAEEQTLYELALDTQGN